MSFVGKNKMKIFTTGYTGKNINDLKPMLEALDAMLIDVRFAPFSQVMCWRKVYLKVLLGDSYRHVPNLGNRTFKEDKITIQNLKLGIETVLHLSENCVLMCACDKLENCHRRLIVEELSKMGIEAVELKDWKTRDSAVQEDIFKRFKF